MWPKGRQNIRFDALSRHIKPTEECTILDYGCGLAHLKEYLDSQGFHANYIGVEIVPDFIDVARIKHPDTVFYLVDESGFTSLEVHHVVISGTFNIIEGNRDDHWASVKDRILKLFSRCTKSLAVNFMSDHVDFVQDHAFHISPGEVIDFVRRSVSRRFTLDQSYMPYEFTVVAYRDTHILNPENVFVGRHE